MNREQKKAWLDSLQVGDKAIRMLAGVIPNRVVVSRRTEELITVVVDTSDPKEKKALDKSRKLAELFGGEPMDESVIPDWDFHPLTGAEIDQDLGWDGVTRTGSYLVPPEQPQE